MPLYSKKEATGILVSALERCGEDMNRWKRKTIDGAIIKVNTDKMVEDMLKASPFLLMLFFALESVAKRLGYNSQHFIKHCLNGGNPIQFIEHELIRAGSSDSRGSTAENDVPPLRSPPRTKGSLGGSESVNDD